MKEESVSETINKSKLSYIDYFRKSSDRTINHLALGDSVIRGYGASEEEGLVSRFSVQLEGQIGKQVDFKNEGINGITSAKLNELIQSGNFDSEIKEADIITLNIGGNDVLRMVKKQDIYSAFKAFDSLQKTFSENLSGITTRIAELNPSATILFLELYNPMPADHEFYSLADKLLPKWNLKIYETAKKTPSTIVVQTTKVINSENPDFLSNDGVHPNPAGYSAISEQMLEQFKNQAKPDAVLANSKN